MFNVTKHPRKRKSPPCNLSMFAIGFFLDSIAVDFTQGSLPVVSPMLMRYVFLRYVWFLIVAFGLSLTGIREEKWNTIETEKKG